MMNARFELETASAALVALADSIEEPNAIACLLSNDTADNFVAMSKSISECRVALESIETIARDAVARESAFHRECLSRIESLPQTALA